MTVVLAGLPTAATSAILSVVGNKVELYGEAPVNSCFSLCFITFPLNTTGKVIKIENVTCQVSIAGSAQLISAIVGPTATPGQSGTLLKKSYFPERSGALNGSSAVYDIASYPGMLLGAKYLQVNLAAGGNINASCSASGFFVP